MSSPINQSHVQNHTFSLTSADPGLPERGHLGRLGVAPAGEVPCRRQVYKIKYMCRKVTVLKAE